MDGGKGNNQQYPMGEKVNNGYNNPDQSNQPPLYYSNQANDQFPPPASGYPPANYNPQYPYPQGSGMAPQYPQPQYYGAPPPNQQQQQQSNVVVVGGQQQTVFAQPRSFVSFTGAIVLSCFVYWCCGWLLGLIAFIVAIVGQNSASSGDDAGARQMLRASYGLSIAGIVIGVVVIIIIGAVMGSSGYSHGSSSGCYYGSCTYYYHSPTYSCITRCCSSSEFINSYNCHTY